MDFKSVKQAQDMVISLTERIEQVRREKGETAVLPLRYALARVNANIGDLVGRKDPVALAEMETIQAAVDRMTPEERSALVYKTDIPRGFLVPRMSGGRGGFLIPAG